MSLSNLRCPTVTAEASLFIPHSTTEINRRTRPLLPAPQSDGAQPSQAGWRAPSTSQTHPNSNNHLRHSLRGWRRLTESSSSVAASTLAKTIRFRAPLPSHLALVAPHRSKTYSSSLLASANSRPRKRRTQSLRKLDDPQARASSLFLTNKRLPSLHIWQNLH
jgi:anti-sigma-K factor RskA